VATVKNSDKIVQSSFRLPKTLLTDFKVQSVKEGRSMSKILTELIDQYLFKKRKEVTKHKNG